MSQAAQNYSNFIAALRNVQNPIDMLEAIRRHLPQLSLKEVGEDVCVKGGSTQTFIRFLGEDKFCCAPDPKLFDFGGSRETAEGLAKTLGKLGS